MNTIARDAAYTDDFVYQWPTPLSNDVSVTCAEDDVVVVCPKFTIGHTLGPGTHTIASAPNLGVYFVRTAAQVLSFEGSVPCSLGGTQELVNIRFEGEVVVKVGDVGLLCHQFVGLPFDNLNGGLVRSVRASLCKQIGKVIARRAASAPDDAAVVSEQAQAAMIDEVISRNPLAGAVFGFAFIRFASVNVVIAERMASPHASSPAIMPPSGVQSGMIDNTRQSAPQSVPPQGADSSSPGIAPPGGWGGAPLATTAPGWGSAGDNSPGVVAGEIGFGGRKSDPALITPNRGDLEKATTAVQPAAQPVAAEVPPGWYPPGSRVLVYWRDGLWHAAVVMQIAQGQYEVELGSSGERAWVPPAAVMPG